jgi:hypothetical protein
LPRAPKLLARELETKLILAAQKGDKIAGDTLIRQHEFWIRYHIRHRRHPDHRDEYQIGLLALWRAILNWKPGYGGLNAYLRLYFMGAIKDFRTDERNGAGFGLSRIQRYLRVQGRWRHSAEQIQNDYPVWHQKHYGKPLRRSYTLRDIEEEKAATRMLFKPVVGLHDQYNHHAGTTGGPYFKDENDGDAKDIDGKPKATSDGVRRQREEKSPESVSVHTRRATKVRWLESLKTEQFSKEWKRGRYALLRGWAPVEFPVMWGRDRLPTGRARSGFVDDKDVRGFGEGLRCVESCAVRPPLPMPIEQEPNARASLWNMPAGHKWMRGSAWMPGSLNVEAAMIEQIKTADASYKASKPSRRRKTTRKLKDAA